VYLSFRTDADDATAGGGLVSFSFRLATYCSLSGGAPPRKTSQNAYNMFVVSSRI
jgi:hypothetical protein